MYYCHAPYCHQSSTESKVAVQLCKAEELRERSETLSLDSSGSEILEEFEIPHCWSQRIVMPL